MSRRPPSLFPIGEHVAGREKMRAIPTGEYRAPRAGEWYLSGAIVEAYRAPNDYAPEWKFDIARVYLVRRRPAGFDILAEVKP